LDQHDADDGVLKLARKSGGEKTGSAAGYAPDRAVAFSVQGINLP
jgi:hypothetical protein